MADFHQISKLRYVWGCVPWGNLWRYQPCSWCQQVSLMSPHPEALFCQCLCNENLFRPVWRTRQRATRVWQIPLFVAERSQVRRLIPASQHFCSTLKCFSPHSHAVPSQRLFSLNRRIMRKRSLQSQTFCKLLRKTLCFSLSNQIYSWAEDFGGVSGAACLSVRVYLTHGS